MKRRIIHLFLFGLLGLWAFAAERIDFQKDVLPILRDNCLACHNETKAKARLVLETPASIVKGGESGPAAVPGKAADSLLIKSSAHLAEPFMPPESNNVGAKNLGPEQIALLRAWINQGATGEVSTAAAPLKWQPLAPGFAPINSVTITEDGQFAACGRGNQIFVYHLPSGVLAARLTDSELDGAAHRDVVQSLSFNPAGTVLASGGYRAIKLWRKQPLAAEKIRPLKEPVHALAISPDGKWIAASVGESGLKLWNSASEPVREFIGHIARVRAVRFSPDGSQLCAASDKHLRIWSVADGQLVTSVETEFEIHAVAWLEGGTQIAAAGKSPAIHVWKLSKQEAYYLDRWECPAAEITSLDSHGGTKLLSGSRDGSVRLWDAANGELIRQMDHGGPVTAVAFRPDGQRLLSGGENKIARLWDAASSNIVAELKGDRYLQEELSRRDRTLIFATNEAAFHKTAVQNAEKLKQTETDTLTKSAAARDAADKGLAEANAGVKKSGEENDLAKKNLELAQAAAKLASQNRNASSNLAGIAAAQLQAAAELLKQSTNVIRSAEEGHEAAFQAVVKAAQDPAKRAVIEQAIEQASAAKTSLANARAGRETAERALGELNALVKQNTEAKGLAEKKSGSRRRAGEGPPSRRSAGGKKSRDRECRRAKGPGPEGQSGRRLAIRRTVREKSRGRNSRKPQDPGGCRRGSEAGGEKSRHGLEGGGRSSGGHPKRRLQPGRPTRGVHR